MDLSEEKELVERARRDPEVFGELYDRYYSQIFGYVLKRVANIEIAQDITSEVFFKALKNLGQFKWRNISFLFGFTASLATKLPITSGKINMR
jgi:DNA-directed RNA polymerase specialized sigma subunit, sigma24 homolog